MAKPLALTAVALVALQLGGCMTDGVYVSRSQQAGYYIPLATVSCEQSCRSTFAASASDYHSCLEKCPDVEFLIGAVCSYQHRTMCEPASRFDGSRTLASVLVAVGTAAYIVLVGALVAALPSDDYQD